MSMSFDISAGTSARPFIERLKGDSSKPTVLQAAMADANAAASLPSSAARASEKSPVGRRFRILTVVDDCTRECLALVADTSLSGVPLVRELTGS
jgi:hypothetical protein